MELTCIHVLSISIVGTGLIFGLRIFRKLVAKKCKCTSKLKKTIVITGATSGLGEACAIELAKRNCRLILGCRNEKLGQNVVNNIRKCNQNSDIVILPLDLTDLESVRQFAISLHDEPIDVLIINAGVIAGHFRMIQSTKTEEAMTVNYLAHFLLTNLLLPNLGVSPPRKINVGDGPDENKLSSRVIFISSSLSKRGRLDLEKLDLSKDPYSPMQAYANSKLAVNLFARELHKRFHGLDTVNGRVNVMTLFTGGMVNTRLGRHMLATYSVFMQPLLRLCFYLLLHDPSDACHSIVHSALSEDLNQSSNELFANFKSIHWPDNVHESEAVGAKLWEKSCEIVGLLKEEDDS